MQYWVNSFWADAGSMLCAQSIVDAANRQAVVRSISSVRSPNAICISISSRHMRRAERICLLVLGLSLPILATDSRLLEAVRNRDEKAVLGLLKQGVDVNAARPDGSTPL